MFFILLYGHSILQVCEQLLSFPGGHWEGVHASPLRFDETDPLVVFWRVGEMSEEIGPRRAGDAQRCTSSTICPGMRENWWKAWQRGSTAATTTTFS